ncbi:hypothetical protein LEP1GSC017_3674 [Leptospira meyeri serovar Hardjo str. Went 5]|nr:hypothetical protein LEP1GSC017_3674 [Leptospira meyeri serovar Hardjo str. Went 5]
MKETHIKKKGNESHLFLIKEEGHLQSFCGLHSMPDYQFKNLKNIFYSKEELRHYLTNTTTLICDICRNKFKMIT